MFADNFRLLVFGEESSPNQPGIIAEFGFERNIYIIVIHDSYTMVIEVKTKKWGNSIGVVIPAEAVERFNLRPDEEIIIEIEKKNNVLKEMFGKAKFKKSSKKMIEDFRKEYDSKWMK